MISLSKTTTMTKWLRGLFWEVVIIVVHPLGWGTNSSQSSRPVSAHFVVTNKLKLLGTSTWALIQENYLILKLKTAARKKMMHTFFCISCYNTSDTLTIIYEVHCCSKQTSDPPCQALIHNKRVLRLKNKHNRPFYSCVLSALAFEWTRGRRWPCFATNLLVFYM